MKSKQLRGMFLCLSLTFSSLVAMATEQKQTPVQSFWNSPVFNVGKYSVTPSRLGGYTLSSARILMPTFDDAIFPTLARGEKACKEKILKTIYMNQLIPWTPAFFAQPTTKEQAIKNATQAVAVGILTDASYDYLPESFKKYCETKYEEYIAQPYLEDHPDINTFIKETVAPWLTTTILGAVYSQAIDQGRIGFSFTFGE